MDMAIGLSFPGTLKDESVICYLCKNFDIQFNIIEASFSMTRGWAILKIDGEEAEINRMFEYLSHKNIKIERIQNN